MKVLLWETSGVPWGVGVAEINNGKSTLQAHFEDAGARTLARQFIQSVDQVLMDANCALSNIEACAVSLGPGSWTGLRIGLTAAKTIAQSLKLPIVGVPTFDVVAQTVHQLDEKTLLLVQSPCRPGELYAKLWHCRGTERDLLQKEWIGSYAQINSCLEHWMHQLAVSDLLTNAPERKIEEPLREAFSVSTKFHKSTFNQRLQALGQLAAMKIQKRDFDNVLNIQPIYLAPSTAEREYHAKHHQK